MEITEEIYAAHQTLSRCSAEFLEYIRENPNGLKRSNFNPVLLAPPSRDKPIHPWPTFISKPMKHQAEEASVKLFDLIKSIPERMFSGELQKMGHYYEMPLNMVELAFLGVNNDTIKNLLGRGDFVFSASGLKCIEYNVQANLGGWELDVLEPLYMDTPVISEFLNTYHVRVHKNRFFFTLLDFIVDNALARFSNRNPGSEINLAFVSMKYTQVGEDPVQSNLNALYQTLLQQKANRLKGDLIFCDFSHLEVVKDSVIFRDKHIHHLVEMSNGLVPMKVIEAVQAGKLLIYNGPVTKIMSNKLNLALLSEHKDSDVFTREERAVIDRYIPWTRKTVPGQTTYGTEKIELEDFILTNRERLVIKPSWGIGGQDVHLGLHASEGVWRQLVERALGQRNWVVQEYIESLPYLYQEGREGCSRHQAVWGFFVFGTRYAGGFVRVLPEKGTRKIINTHQGAEKSIIIEVEA